MSRVQDILVKNLLSLTPRLRQLHLELWSRLHPIGDLLQQSPQLIDLAIKSPFVLQHGQRLRILPCVVMNR